MKDLKLNLLDAGDMPLPKRIVDSGLALTELGAVVFLIAVASGQCGFDHPRMQEPQMILALKSLENRGVFRVAVNGTRVGISVNLDLILPPL